jgi:SSU ribosomal protein S18P
VRRTMAARRKKKKRCQWCMEGIRFIDYKSVNRLQRFIDSKGKILPRRQTGNCARHQRQLAVAVKRARIMGLLPFVVY